MEIIETVAPVLLTVEETAKLMVSSIPIGLILGAIPFVIGLAVSGIVKIFKKA